jgi:hypothetical protein
MEADTNMNANQTKIIGVIAICLVLGSSVLTVASIFGANNPVGDFFAAALGFDVTPPVEGEARINSVIYKLGEESTYPSATVLIGYDHDGDGTIELGNFQTGDGEIETKSATSSSGFTSGYYPIGETLKIQLQASGYETVEYERVVAGTPDSNGIIYLDYMPMMLLDSSITVTVDMVGTAGTVAMVTSSGDYNRTTNGNIPIMTIRVACGTTDAGIGTKPYVDWITGKSYHGTFVAVKILLTEKSNINFGSYDYIGNDGTNQWIVWDVTNPCFNDASLDSDGSFSLSFGITLYGDFDFDEINVYNSVTESDFGQFIFGTADGQETDLDVVS